MRIVQVRTTCGSGWVKPNVTRPLPQAVLTDLICVHPRKFAAYFLVALAAGPLSFRAAILRTS